MVLQNLDVVRKVGISTEDLSVDFHIPQEDRTYVRRILREHTPPIPPLKKGGKKGYGKALVHVHPTSRWLFKCWKDEYMAEVISWLVSQGTTVVVTSSPATKEMEKARRILSIVSSRITSHASRVIDLSGRTTIKQLGAISEAADLFFGVDSAPMHIAAAVGTPVVALFGPSGAFHWGPWDNESSKFKVQSSKSGSPYFLRNGVQVFGIHTVIQMDWDCIPCGSDGCGGSKISRCLEEISVDELRKVITERLEMAGR
jgi:heptosyltransferase-3